tara:strand:+ start:253 stop:471 length:219 start_codon:yes stop_codon:yes gene_type:complete
MSQTRARYVLPTGISILQNKVLEMMQAHSSGKDYKYDHFPLVRMSEAINDQNTVIISQATDSGTLGESGNLV